MKLLRKDCRRGGMDDKNFYNESSSAKLGWEPQWLGCDEFDDELVEAIKKFQKKIA